MKNEINALTGIRGIAAMMIVVLHLSANYEKAALPLSWYSLPYKITSAFGVAIYLFFVLSAFLLSYADGHYFTDEVKGKDYLLFLKKRVLRVYPLYFFNVLILTLFGPDKFEIQRFLINISLANVFFPHEYNYNGVYWTLSAEFFMYLIFPFMFLAIRKRRIVLNLIGVASIIYVLNLSKIPSYYFKNGSLDRSFNLIMSGSNALVRCFCAYFIGINAFTYAKKITNYISKYLIIIVLLILIVTYLPLSELWLYVLFSLLILQLKSINWLSKFLSKPFVYFLGEISYSIYLNHFLLIILAWKYIPHANHSIVALFTFIAVIPLSYLTYKFVEKRFQYHRLSVK